MPRAFFSYLFGGSDLPAHELRQLQLLAHERRYRPGQEIFRAGELSDAVFGLSRGVVSHSRHLPDGRRQVIRFGIPGEFLGVPLAVQHTVSARAIGEVAVCRFRRDDFFKFAFDHPGIMGLLVKAVTCQFEQAQSHILLLGSGTAEEKTAAFLLTWRNRLADSHDPSVSLPLPRRGEIADYLGLTIETVGRMLTRFEGRNLIQVVLDGVKLLDTEQLELISRPFEHAKEA
jgi:CRP/FNR family transcriptional regulator, anaerobic regulatory protein